VRILVALDDSVRAAQKALDLARLERAELTVLFVLDATWNVYLGHDFLSGSNARSGFLEWARDQEAAEESRIEAAFRALAGDTPFTWKSAAGRVTDEILKEAARGYDLLVVSNPFRRGLEIVRDAPAEILKGAACSVLFVRR
jgi:nucleotide-binding universal stress UspA family protein